MSQFDYQQGQQLGEFLGRRHARLVQRDASEAIGEWEDYAHRLEEQLAAANVKLVSARACEAANNELARDLRQRLLAQIPSDPILQPGVLTEKLHSKIRAGVEAAGYRVVNMEPMEITRK